MHNWGKTPPFDHIFRRSKAQGPCKHALEIHLDQTARPVWVHPQLDKLSQGWVHSLPGPKGLNQTLFSETMARLLCLFSPSCAARVGEPLGQRGLVVDPFGDNVLSVSNIPRGSFTARHDLVKTCLQTLCLDAGLRAECKVFGAFRDLLPAQGLEQDEELRAGRNRAGLIPEQMRERWGAFVGHSLN